MRISISTIFFLALFLSINICAQTKWEIANENIVRLAPAEFSQLPKPIIDDLTKRQCKIPQSYFYDDKHNVVQGEFKNKGQKDWAVLCSVNKLSSIYVYWNGSPDNVSIIEVRADFDFLQTIDGDGKIGFSRIIGSVGAKYIYDHYRSYGGVKPPDITHDGINDAFAEKASTVRYFHKDKWLELQGAD